MLEHPIALSSTPLRGTRFRVWVGEADGQAGPLAAPVDSGVAPSPTAEKALPRHVLVVDDEPVSREAMGSLLSACGCRVHAAGDLERAHLLLAQHPIEAVVADFRLPGTHNGLDFLLALRLSSPQVRTLLVTGETSAQRITDIRASGVPFLHKPVRAQQLLEALAG